MDECCSTLERHRTGGSRVSIPRLLLDCSSSTHSIGETPTSAIMSACVSVSSHRHDVRSPTPRNEITSEVSESPSAQQSIFAAHFHSLDNLASCNVDISEAQWYRTTLHWHTSRYNTYHTNISTAKQPARNNHASLPPSALGYCPLAPAPFSSSAKLTSSGSLESVIGLPDGAGFLFGSSVSVIDWVDMVI